MDRTVRGKRGRADVAWMLFRRREVLERLAATLHDGSWRPSGFEILRVRDPKPRAIARASVEDRVVHSALTLAMEPILLRSTIPQAFACRRGGGAHRAVLHLAALIRRHRFALHLDVRAFFPSIDVAVLRGLLATRIRDARFLAVMDRVFESGLAVYRHPAVRRFAGLEPDWPPPGCGLPIGASTSQALATHLYLVGLDHSVKRELRVPGYARYVDDLFLFGDRRADLRGWRAAVGRWLERERGLRLKHPAAPVLSCGGHLDALGYRIDRAGWRARPRALRRLRRRIAAGGRRAPGAATRAGRSGRRPVDLQASIASTAGVVLF